MHEQAVDLSFCKAGRIICTGALDQDLIDSSEKEGYDDDKEERELLQRQYKESVVDLRDDFLRKVMTFNDPVPLPSRVLDLKKTNLDKAKSEIARREKIKQREEQERLRRQLYPENGSTKYLKDSYGYYVSVKDNLLFINSKIKNQATKFTIQVDYDIVVTLIHVNSGKKVSSTLFFDKVVLSSSSEIKLKIKPVQTKSEENFKKFELVHNSKNVSLHYDREQPHPENYLRATNTDYGPCIFEWEDE